MNVMITENYLEVAPAYGRDYKNKTDATNDFLAGNTLNERKATHGPLANQPLKRAAMKLLKTLNEVDPVCTKT